MNRTTLLAKATTALLLLCYLCMPAQVFADNEQLILSPIASTLNTVAGQKLNIQFSLTNTAKPLRVKLSVAEILNGQVVERNDQFDAATWITLTKTSAELPTNLRVEFPVQIDVPKTATLGAHKVLIIATPETATPTEANGATVLGAVSYVITLNVVENAPKETVSAETTLPWLTLENTVKFSYKISNPEKVTVNPIGYLRLFNPAGEIVYQEVVNAEQRPLDNQGEILGEHAVALTIDDIRDIGNYRLEFLALDPGFQTSDLAVKTTLFIPWWLIVTTVFLVVTILSLVIVLRRRRHYSAKSAIQNLPL